MPEVNDSRGDVLESVDAARDELVELLQQLVRVPTVNAGPRPDTGNETLACELLGAKLAAAGVAYEVHESAPGRGNLIAHRPTPWQAAVVHVAHRRGACRGRNAVGALAVFGDDRSRTDLRSGRRR